MRKYSLGTVGYLQNGCAAAVLGFILFAVLGGTAKAQTSGTTLKITDSPRPVLQAIMDLTKKYGYVITYEDPKYVYQDDMKDVTQERRDLSQFPAGRAPKTYELIGGGLTLKLPNQAEIDESMMYGLLSQLVQSWFDSNQGGGHFQVQQQDGIFHVSPTDARDSNGNWRSTQSILGSPISLPTQSRDDWQTYKAIGWAVSAVVGIKIVTLVNGGIVLGGAPDAKEYVLGAQDEPASSVLMRAFNIMGKRRTWYLLYEPTLRAYVLNIDDLAGPSWVAPSSSPATPSAQTQKAPADATPALNPSAATPNCHASATSPPCRS